MKVGIIEHFDSMHLLPSHPKCGVPHGHTYKVEVVVDGELKNGMVIDFDQLKKLLREILRVYDHTDLNKLFPFPSCENIALNLHSKLKLNLNNYKVTVKIWEGEGKWAEFSDS
ncbi:MAG: 6-carboxytetrahydropterin synthase [Planctomycetes bacterium]|nr:6-carboxytetrahydropterin synthase [Planctomycetota bacterium]